MNIIKKINKEIAFFISITCMLLTSTIYGLGDCDFIWQSFLGKTIITEGDFYGIDRLIWGTLNVHPYYDHEWLCNVFFYGLTVLFGKVYSIIVTKVIIELLVGITLFFFLKQVIKTFDNMSFITYLASVVMTYCFSALLIKPKAYDISLVLMMLLLIVLEKRKEQTISFSRFSVYVCILTLLWNNIHSGSIILLVSLTGLYWLIYWRDIKTVVLGLICVVLLGINPYGYRLIWFDFTHNSDNVMKAIIRDWHSLDLKMTAGKVICFLLVLIIVHLVNLKVNKDNMVFVVMFIVFFVMTVSSMRHFLYLYPIGMLIVQQGQFKDFSFIKTTNFGIPTYFVCVFVSMTLVFFGVNFHNVQDDYTMTFITPELNAILEQTIKNNNDGLFTGDINVWSSEYKSFQSGAFPHTRERTIDAYTMMHGSETQIRDIIDYYKLNKFLFYKTDIADTDYTLNTNLYDYMINRPDRYALLYDNDIVVYFVDKQILDEG